MSVNVMIRTNLTEVDLSKTVHALADKGYKIEAFDMSNEYCEYCLYKYSTRTVSISKEENGYYVRITTLAKLMDYELFIDTIDVLSKQVEGKVYIEDDDDCFVENPKEYFNEDWIVDRIEGDYRSLIALSYHKKDDGTYSEITLFGPYHKFCIGINLLKDLGIDRKTDFIEGHKLLTERFCYSQYSRSCDIEKTSTRLSMRDPEALSDIPDDECMKKISLYDVNKSELIVKSDYFCFNAEDRFILLKYDDFMKIAPHSWERFDNSQYFTEKLSDKELAEFVERAKDFEL